jgi:DNA primase
MANDDVRRVKDQIDIVVIIGDKVRLRPSGPGGGYIGLCPFHDEKTPSFRVSRERQNYHCFGCGKGGDIFSFVMETEGLDFRAALELLAERAGIELTDFGAGRGGKKRSVGSLHEVMEIAGKAFRALLSAPEGEAARAYLARRNISPETAARFELGWSGASWDATWRTLKNEGVSPRDAVDAGLTQEGQRGLYDRFRGRVMFPIRDVSGRLVAFGGRIVDGEGPKYINSPESALYSKRRNLYLLHAAKKAVQEKARAILTEGYMDALRLHMHGHDEAVASLGTSLTEDQAKLLKRFSNRCYICYDSDAAGQEATIRGMYTLQNFGLDVYVISLPVGKDPDELLNSEGGSALFEEALAKARPLVLQHLHTVRPLLDNPAARRGGVDSLFDGLLQLPPTSITPYVPQLAADMRFYPDQFWREFEQRRGRLSRMEPRKAPEEKGGQNGERLVFDALEAALCSLLWRDAEFRAGRREEVLALLSDARVKEIALAIMMESPEELEVRWHSTGERFALACIARGDSFCEELEFSQTPDADLRSAICDALRRKRAEERMGRIDERMKRHEATPEDLAEFQRLATQLKSGKKRASDPAQKKAPPRFAREALLLVACLLLALPARSPAAPAREVRPDSTQNAQNTVENSSAAAQNSVLEIRFALSRQTDATEKEKLYLRLIDEYPETQDAEEAHWALSSLYLDDFDEPREEDARKILERFLARYPSSLWAPHAEGRLLWLRGVVEKPL